MPSSPEPRPWLLATTVLGLAHAAVSLWWALGGTWLLGTVGGQIEEWGRAGSPGLRLLLLVVVAVKVTAVALTWLAVLRGGRIERILAWTAGAVLTAYGGMFTFVGVLVVSDVVSAPAEADLYALKWHALFWDPWFLLWGLCTLAAMWLSRSGRPQRGGVSHGE
ncbi:DUF3995 domain-containing protein [Aeromicrobium sp.]|uniref:DUF3995 domain-containing protein n=1 Tax=Aeromicrobium sp. TaxID=1871063 RepID=UPI0030C20DFF